MDSTISGITRETIVQAFAEKKQKDREKLAFCFVGGGAKGEWELGAARVLHRIGLLDLTDILIGTSVGGLNSVALGVSLANGNGIQDAEKVWAGITKNSDVFTPDMPSGFLSYLLALFKINTPSLTTPGGLRAIVNTLVGSRTATDLHNLNGRIIATVATNYVSQQAETLTGDMKLYDMAMATCAIPAAFPAHLGTYGDGAILNNDPVDKAIELGATKVLVLFCDPDSSDPVKETAANPFIPSTKNNVLKALDIMYKGHEDAMWKYITDMTKKNVALGGPQVEWMMLWPNASTGGLLDFKKRGLADMGEKDAEQEITTDRLSRFLLT